VRLLASPTGKTTLSADPSRTLIGDDEHGWARPASSTSRRLLRQVIKPQPRAEPEIYAPPTLGTVLENW